MRTSYADEPGDARGSAARGFPPPARRTVLRLRLPGGRRWLVLLLLLVGVVVLGAAGTGYSYRPLAIGKVKAGSAAPTTTRELASLRQEQKRLLAALAKKTPRASYIVVDRTNNRLYVKQGDRVLLQATCSAGSGLLLREPDGTRSWIFDTPRGSFRVLSKTRNPVWKKPDWAFIEEGKPIPSNPSERIEYGTLGEFALHFGNGYMIHGTLYERLLGRPVTHGCIRLGKADLRRVYESAPIGTPIFVY